MAYTLDPTKIQIVPEAGGFTIKIPGSAIGGAPDAPPPPQPPAPPVGQTAFKCGVTQTAPLPLIVPFGGSDLSVFGQASAASPVNVKFPSGAVYGVTGTGKDINGNPALTTAQNVAPSDAQWGTKFSVTTDPVSGGLPAQPPPTVPPTPLPPPAPPPSGGNPGKRSDALGCYFYPNPGTAEKNPTYDENYAQFVSEMGAKPRFINTFVDHSSNPVQPQQNQSQYWWSNPMRGNRYGLIPVCGVVSSNSWDGSVRESQMRDVAAGKYDKNYVNAVEIWRDAGFGEIYLRVDWEMNGTFMPWNWIDNSKQSLLNAGIAAFRHIHSCAQSVSGIKVWTEWNPCSQGYLWTGDDTALWVGDDLQNIIMALDIYSYTGWRFGGPDNRLKSWASDVNNRIQYWDHPGSFGLADHLAHAAKRNRPWALSETGVGYNQNGPDAGIDDDPAFPAYLAQRFDSAQTPCKHVNIWTLNTGDGQWDYLRGKKPQSAKAWRTAFGAG